MASAPITVEAATATLSAPGSVKAGTEFRVNWTGPANKRDFVTLFPAGSPKEK